MNKYSSHTIIARTQIQYNKIFIKKGLKIIEDMQCNGVITVLKWQIQYNYLVLGLKPYLFKSKDWEFFQLREKYPQPFVNMKIMGMWGIFFIQMKLLDHICPKNVKSFIYKTGRKKFLTNVL